MSPISSTKRTRRTLGFATSAVLAGSLIMAALALALAAPTIDDTEPQVGDTLTASADAGMLEWLRCDSDPCENVVGVGNTYAPVDADVGHPLRARLTVDGEGSAVSEPTAAVTAAQPPPVSPEITQDPDISGLAYVGEKLTASGQTNGEMTTWQWQTCLNGTCNDVGLPTTTYEVQAGDVGKRIRVILTGTNTGAQPTSKASPLTDTVPNPPRVIRGPTIFTAVEVGETASATASWADGSEAWQWMLCNSATVNESCYEIAGAREDSYVVASQDAGSWLGVRLIVQGRGPDTPPVYSAGKFISKPEDPVPPTPPAPFTSTGTTPDTPAVSAPTLLDPFPIVRIKGRTTRVGARLTLLSVRAPRGTLIRVRCRSDYCPRSRLAINTRLHRLRVFERSLRAGVIIEIRVKHPKRIGKYTRFLIRRAAPPLRRDRCLRPGSNRPTRCPGA
jgi:hypothetical protein